MAVLAVLIGFGMGFAIALGDRATMMEFLSRLAQAGAPGADGRPGVRPEPESPSTEAAPAQLRYVASSRDPAVTIPASRDGHFYVTANVDGRDIRFLIDTGATAVVLTREDARRLGLNPASWEYTRTVQTVRGQIRLAPATLRRVRIGSLQTTNVAALIGDHTTAGISLLGMSFLQQVQRYEVRNNTMYLYR